MNSEARLFDEFAAAHQFPYYFGENWDAFSECLSDLSWMPGARYLTIVTDAAEVLREERRRFRTFLEVLNDAGREWSEPGTSARPWAPEPRAFHVVLQSVGGARTELSALLAEAGVAHETCGWT